MSEGNRKDPRARVLNMTVRYKSATVDEFIENHSHDISRGGIFIKTRSPFPAGTLLKFEVRIAEDQKLMHGVGRVVWRREVDRAEESYPAGMGIKFIKTGEGAAELINQLVAAREGAESSFDAGVRETVTAPAAGRPSSVPPTPTPVAPKPSSPSPTSSPSLSVDSGPRSLGNEAETAVTSPAKKRQDQAPEKRKVVLQGPALETPPSKPRPSPRPAASSAESGTPPARPNRGSIAEETTARRTRPSVKKASDTPRWSGLVLILGLVGLVVFVVNRMRGPSADEDAAPAPTVVAEPPQVPPLPAAEAQPSDEAAAAAPAPVQPASATEPPAGSQPAAPPALGTEPAASAAPAPSGTAAAAPAAGEPPAVNSPSAPAPSAPPAPSPPAANPTPPTSASPQKAPAPAPAKPPAPAPAPAPAKPPPPKPSASVAPAAPPAAEPAPKPAEPAPPPPAAPPPAAAAGSGGGTESPPPAKKPPAAAAPAPAPTPPAAAPPAAAPAPPPPLPADDNPY
jgi:uncharacterized protein (TIGR02266 family)